VFGTVEGQGQSRCRANVPGSGGIALSTVILSNRRKATGFTPRPINFRHILDRKLRQL